MAANHLLIFCKKTTVVTKNKQWLPRRPQH